MGKKCIFLLFLIVLCTGCSVEYTLTINEDLSIKEEIIALENKDFYDNYYKSTTSRVIDLVMSTNKEYLNKNEYAVNKIIGEKSGVNIAREFFDFEEYYNISEFDTQMFSDFNYKQTGRIIEINAEGLITKEPDLIEKFIINEAIIKIKLPFKVISNNADKYDAFTNTYSWEVNDDIKQKKIHLEFDTSKNSINVKKLSYYTIVGIVIGLIILYFIYIMYKRKKNNRI